MDYRSSLHEKRLCITFCVFRWARLGLNQRPLPCEGNALPLSYAPECEHADYARIEDYCKAGWLKFLKLQGIFMLTLRYENFDSLLEPYRTYC